MSWDLAQAFGAHLPRSIEEHRAMLRDGKHIKVRVTGDTGAGLCLFWKVDPEFIARSS